MKKTILFMSMAAAFLFAGCQKEQSAKTLTLTASIEQQQEANKTSLLGGFVVWSLGDAINVFTNDPNNNNYQFKLKSGVGSTQASFSSVGEVSGNPTYAIYPYAAGNTISGSTITFNLPAEQTYAANSFANGANVAVAEVTGAGMYFKNVCGALKLQLKGSMCVKTIEITGKNNEKLNGAFTVNVIADPFVGAVKDGDPEEAEKTVTLNCGDGVQLDIEHSTDFYIVVPAGAFAAGFDAKITDVAGDTYYKTLSTTSETVCTISRSIVRKMPSKTVSVISGGYTEIKYIESRSGVSEGGQYIDTGYVVDADDVIMASISIDKTVQSLYYPSLFGYEVGLQRMAIRLQSSVSYAAYFMDKSWIPIDLPTDETKFEIVVDFPNGLCSYANSRIAFSPAYANLNLYLFTINFQGAPAGDSYIVQKLFRFIITSSGTTIKRLIPVKKISDGTIGMYDVISGTLFTNAGNGTFIAGPELTD